MILPKQSKKAINSKSPLQTQRKIINFPTRLRNQTLVYPSRPVLPPPSLFRSPQLLQHQAICPPIRNHIKPAAAHAAQTLRLPPRPNFIARSRRHRAFDVNSLDPKSQILKTWHLYYPGSSTCLPQSRTTPWPRPRPTRTLPSSVPTPPRTLASSAPLGAATTGMALPAPTAPRSPCPGCPAKPTAPSETFSEAPLMTMESSRTQPSWSVSSLTLRPKFTSRQGFAVTSWLDFTELRIVHQMRIGDLQIVLHLTIRNLKMDLASNGKTLRLGMVAWTRDILVVGLNDFSFTTDDMVGFEFE